MDAHLVKKSKYLSWLLRHGAGEQGLSLDDAGWTSLEELLRVARLTREELDQIAGSDSKQRLQIDNGRMRACQGHGRDSGVTREGLEASWTVYQSDAPVWHGTSTANVGQIAGEGILPLARTHVHCAPTRDSLVGKRGSAHVLLEIAPDKVRAAGLCLFVAPNGVILARCIPRQAIVGLVPLTKGAKQREAELRACLGLPSAGPAVDLNSARRRTAPPTPPGPDESVSDRPQ